MIRVERKPLWVLMNSLEDIERLYRRIVSIMIGMQFL